MNGVTLAIAYGLIAGMMIPLGGFIASIERIRPAWVETEVRHSVMAFGGGVLIAAVSLVLVPEGLRELSAVPALLSFAGGGIAIGVAELYGGRGLIKPQFLAMLADFLPEAIALGALLASGASSTLLLAMLIGLQNLPEGFNAYREFMSRDASTRRRRKVLGVFAIVGLLGPLTCLFGYFVLADFRALNAAIMLAAAGAILFLMFQDIAPRAHLRHKVAPSLAGVAGFSLGLLGQALLG
ncbi:MAG: ZIP family metal transporter [Flavobacteriaceae bacterium]